MAKEEASKRLNSKAAYQVVLNRGFTRTPNDRPFRDKWRQSQHQYGRVLAKYSRFLLTRIRMYEPPTMEDVTCQGGVLCRDFIYQRLKRQSLLSLKLELHPSAARASEVAIEIQLLATELEKQYPHLYHNVCRQINTVMSSEVLARNTFQNIADAMLNGTQITWGRVVALFSITGALSAECVQQGHPEFVRCIVDVFKDVTRTYLAAWIVNQGGWSDVTRVFRTNKETSALWAMTGIGAFVGFAVTLATSLAL